MLNLDIDSFKRLLTKQYREADIYALRDGEGDAEIALLLHLTDLDRLLLYAYREIDGGALFKAEPRPSTKERCDAVVAWVHETGCERDSLTDERLASLMRLSGLVKHALLPRVVDARFALGQARETFEDLYRRLFGEPVPWCPTLLDPRHLGPVVLEFPDGEAGSILWDRIRERLISHLDRTETEVFDLLGLWLVTDAIHSVSIRSVQSRTEYHGLGQTALLAVIEEFADGYDFERDQIVAEMALKAFAGLRSIIRTEAAISRMARQGELLMHVSDATLALSSIGSRFAVWDDLGRR